MKFISVQRQAPESDCDYQPFDHKPLHEWGWDVSYLALGSAAMVTLVVLLACNDQKPLRPWVLGITLNGVIAVLSFTWKACMISVCSSCIGQLKWQWFQAERRLIDVEIFDEASRGGPSSVRRLLTIPSTRARIAGLFILLSMAFDPFVQQLVSSPTTTARTSQQHALARRGVTYTMGPPNLGSV